MEARKIPTPASTSIHRRYQLPPPSPPPSTPLPPSSSPQLSTTTDKNLREAAAFRDGVVHATLDNTSEDEVNSLRAAAPNPLPYVGRVRRPVPDAPEYLNLMTNLSLPAFRYFPFVFFSPPSPLFFFFFFSPVPVFGMLLPIRAVLPFSLVLSFCAPPTEKSKLVESPVLIFRVCLNP